jgi:predicted nuclease of predicted toxin-antitoxin system
MARIALYLDEQVQIGLAEALRVRGVDVLTTQEAGNIGVSDLEQLNCATGNGRSLFSYN